MTVLESTRLNQEVFKNIQITSHENMIMKSLEKFYEIPENISLFIPIVNSESKISIRLIDHFITKYSKKNKVCYKNQDSSDNSLFYVFQSYRQQLRDFTNNNYELPIKPDFVITLN